MNRDILDIHFYKLTSIVDNKIYISACDINCFDIISCSIVTKYTKLRVYIFIGENGEAKVFTFVRKKHDLTLICKLNGQAFRVELELLKDPVANNIIQDTMKNIVQFSPA